MAVTIEQLTESGTYGWCSFYPPLYFDFLLPISPMLLPSIGVGQVVKGLRKHAEADIQAKAKAAFARWKENFKKDALPAAPEQVAAADWKVEKKKMKIKTDAKDEGPATSFIPQPAVPPSPQENKAAASGEEGKRYVGIR